MSLTYFDPLSGLRLFEDAFTRMMTEPSANRPWSPNVDVYETENELVLKADLPEVELKDIDVRVENQTLTVAGERKFAGTIPERLITGLSAATATLCGASRFPACSIQTIFPPRSRTARLPLRCPRKRRPSRGRSKSK